MFLIIDRFRTNLILCRLYAQQLRKYAVTRFKKLVV